MRASYSPKETKRVNHRRIILYKGSEWENIFEYRTRLAKALKSLNGQIECQH